MVLAHILLAILCAGVLAPSNGRALDIQQVQGRGHVSPLLGQDVEGVEGVVTAVQTAVVGLIVTLEIDGGALPTTISSLAEGPVTSPSSGVTSTAQTSPRAVSAAGTVSPVWEVTMPFWRHS